MDSAKNGRWIFPFKKFGMVRVIICMLYYQIVTLKGIDVYPVTNL